MLGPLFTGMEHKWYVDEGYKALILDPFTRLTQFLAITIDEKFWHDWFHEKVIVAGFNYLTNIALDRYTDQRGIDAFFNGLADWTRRASASLAPHREWLRPQLCSRCPYRCRSHFRIYPFPLKRLNARTLRRSTQNV